MKISDESFYKLKNMVSLFNDFTEEELITVLKLSISKIYSEGERVFKEKESGESLYIIAKGSVRISKKISAEFEEPLATMRSGNYFGEMSIVDNMPRSASATAAEANTILLEINKNILNQNLGIAFKFYRNFAKVIAERLRKTNEKLLDTSSEKNNLQSKLKFFVKSKLDQEQSMNNCNFKGANLTGVFFSKVSMASSIMTGANLSGVTFKNLTFENAVFSGSDIQSGVFESCDFSHANFSNSTFEKSIFKNCKFDDEYIRTIVTGNDTTGK